MLKEPRQIGKASVKKTKPGHTVYKEIVTKGWEKYQIQDPITGKWNEYNAELHEVVPFHTPCSVCSKYISNKEADMAEVMITPKPCGACKKVQIERNLDKNPIEVICKHTEQVFICFECYEDMCNAY